VKIKTLAETEADDKAKADNKVEEKSEKKDEKKDEAAPADKQEPSDDAKVQTKSHIRIGDDKNPNNE